MSQQLGHVQTTDGFLSIFFGVQIRRGHKCYIIFDVISFHFLTTAELIRFLGCVNNLNKLHSHFKRIDTISAHQWVTVNIHINMHTFVQW